MKIIFIPRVDHEVYFIPFIKIQPDKKYITNFLKSNHPYYNLKFFTDCRPCNICGKNYLMVTVVSPTFHYNKKKIFQSRILTAAAILTSSSYASILCTIRCPEEMLLFNETPESIPRNLGDNSPFLSDVSFSSEKELLALLRKEKIHISLFNSRWKKPLCIALALLCIVACASFSTNTKKNVLEAPIKTPIILAENKPLFDQFWLSFSQEITAVNDTKGFIEQYSYSANREPSHILNIKKSDPGVLSEKLLNTTLFQNIAIQDIQYIENVYRFTLCSSSVAIIKDSKGFSDIYNHIRTVEQLCTENNYTLTAVVVSAKPLFSIHISDSSIRNLMEKLYHFCVTNKITLDTLDLQHSPVTATISAQISFAEATVTTDIQLPDTAVFFSTFNIKMQKSQPVKKNVQPDEKVQIGKIQKDNNTFFIFSKSDSGKITMKKEGK